MKPTPLPVRVEGIPEAIRAERRWVVWNYEWREDKKKWTKPPFIATAPQTKAASTDPATWRSFSDAVGAYEDGKCDGIGFVLGDAWVGFDADGTDAPEHVHLLNTYTERSPSGQGIHALMRGTKPQGRSRTGPFELYDGGRYFTVTGHHVPGTPATVEERTTEIAAVYTRLFTKPDAEPKPEPQPSRLSDDDLIARAKAAGNGAKFAALWSGDTSDYGGDDSKADLALCGMLAWWTNGDATQMDRLFRRSELMRGKWDDRRGNTTWGAGIIAKAIEGASGGYSGAERFDDVPHPATAEPSKRQVALICAKDVKVETLQWLHTGRFAYGAITLVEGGPEKGKSTLLCDYAARVSTGAPFPGETDTREPSAVVMLIAEDDVATTVVPRLMAAGADLSRVFFLSATRDEKGEVVPFHLSDDCERLQAQCEHVHATFIVVDPLVSFLGSRRGKSLDSYNDMEVRKSLSPLKSLAEHLRASIAAIRHYKKRPGTDALEAGGGSIGFTALVRVVVAALPDPDNDGDYLFAVAKNNLVAKTKRPAISYQIVPSETNPDIARVQWGNTVEMSANEILEKQAKADRESMKGSSPKVDEAAAFLTEFLKPGVPVKSKELYKAAKEMRGLSEDALHRAKVGMAIVVEKESGKAGGEWTWMLTVKM